MTPDARVLRFPSAVSGTGAEDYGRFTRELSADELAGCFFFTDDDRSRRARPGSATVVKRPHHTATRSVKSPRSCGTASPGSPRTLSTLAGPSVQLPVTRAGIGRRQPIGAQRRDVEHLVQQRLAVPASIWRAEVGADAVRIGGARGADEVARSGDLYFVPGDTNPSTGPTPGTTARSSRRRRRTRVSGPPVGC
jgi:hypothetical protein